MSTLAMQLCAAIVLAVLTPSAGAAETGAELAMDKGCYSCHGNAARGNAPSFATLAQRYAPRKGDAAFEQHVVDELLHQRLIGRIRSHERLSAESAALLVRWLFDGAPP